MRQIEWSEPALADLARLDRIAAIRVKQAVERFANAGIGGAKKLQGIDPPMFRLRVGDYRVLFRRNNKTINVARVRNRREAYR